MRKITALAFALALGSTALAAPPADPTLRTTRDRDGGIRVHWTLVGVLPRTGRTLEVQRAGTGGFVPLASISEPKRRQSTVDRPGAGQWSYRVRLTTEDGTSGWSNVVTVSVGGTVQPPPVTPPPTTSPGGPLPTGLSECPAGSVADVLRLTNDARRGAGVGALGTETHLMAAARTRAITIAKAGVLSHDGWVATIQATGYAGGALGENIAYGYPSAAAVMNGWLGSAGHRANILNGGYRDIGIGCVVDGRGRLWWTQDFGG